MIHIKELKKVYDNGYEALKSINLEINEGELVCLLGPSGCGKTTILNLLSGLLDTLLVVILNLIMNQL